MVSEKPEPSAKRELFPPAKRKKPKKVNKKFEAIKEQRRKKETLQSKINREFAEAAKSRSEGSSRALYEKVHRKRSCTPSSELSKRPVRPSHIFSSYCVDLDVGRYKTRDTTPAKRLAPSTPLTDYIYNDLFPKKYRLNSYKSS